MWSATAAYFVFSLFYSVGLASDGTPPLQNDNFSNNQKTVKRSEFDSQTCSENFDVHNDKIIRTQDSINMGAKYLNEDDLRSRKDCLRFCCETEMCDVFVFEEKSPGSCYLFHCGPPDDFKCKFTKHKNYTSAVMSASRNRLLAAGGPSELEEQIRLTKHEQQLVRLRKPEPETMTPPPPQAVPEPVTPPPPPPPPPAPTASPSAASATSATPGRACSRFQFECRVSGECIAIYNACDGIPQCADGSDEAPELDCPAPAATTSPAFVPITQGAPTMIPPVKIAEQHDLSYNPEQYRQQSDLESNKMKVLQRPQLMESSQMQNIGMHFKPNNVMHSAQYDYLQPQQYQANQNNIQLRGEEKNYQKIDNPPQQARGNPYYNKDVESQSWPGYQHQYQQYDDQSNHIFNHKGKGLVTDTDRYNYNGFHPDRYNPTSQYEAPHDYKFNDGSGNYYNNQAFRQPIMQNWQGQPGHQSNHVSDQSNSQVEPSKLRHDSAGSSQFYSSGPVPPDYYYEDSQEGAAGVRNQQHLHQQGNRESIADSASPIQSKVPLSVDHHQQHHDGVQKEAVQLQEENATNNDGMKNINKSVTKSDSTTPKSVKQKNNDGKSNKTKHKNGFHSKDADLQLGLDESDVIIEPIDGQSDRPNGAILSLVLGLCLTGIMVTLVGCRLRLVRRRLRRGGKSPYTHDADYLVNGMYL